MAWRISFFFNYTATEIRDELITESDKVDSAIAVETVRREVVKTICPTLFQEILVNDLQLIGYVVSPRTQKPAGQQAEFRGDSVSRLREKWRFLPDFIIKSQNVKYPDRNASGHSGPSTEASDEKRHTGTTFPNRSGVRA